MASIDHHTKRAMELFQCSFADVTPEMRNAAKIITHVENYSYTGPFTPPPDPKQISLWTSLFASMQKDINSVVGMQMSINVNDLTKTRRGRPPFMDRTMVLKQEFEDGNLVNAIDKSNNLVENFGIARVIDYGSRQPLIERYDRNMKFICTELIRRATIVDCVLFIHACRKASALKTSVYSKGYIVASETGDMADIVALPIEHIGIQDFKLNSFCKCSLPNWLARDKGLI